MDSLYLYRYNEAGDTLWTRYLTSDTTLAPRKCIETSSGDFVIVGLHVSPRGAYMFRLNSQGDSIAFVNFGNNPAFFAMSVVEDAEQNLFIAGYTDTGISEFQFRGYILKCTPGGDVFGGMRTQETLVTTACFSPMRVGCWHSVKRRMPRTFVVP
ncbi:MAG: hypothetical protein IPH60_05185 [Flavobacteriales bacterium]|nr:hypothetical protein [Flavobacteriales bacterium]